MTGYICDCEVTGEMVIGLFPTREAAERHCMGNGVAKIDASQHVHRLVKPVFFDNMDQSYPQLVRILSKKFG